MVEPNYCPKCKKWNVFGELNPNEIIEERVEEQMKKDGIKGNASKLYEKDKIRFDQLYEKYLEEKKLIEAGCETSDMCAHCGTKLIEKRE